MRISFLTPERGVFTGGRNWMMWIYDLLAKRHDVLLNNCDSETEVILGMTDSQKENIIRFHRKFPSIPLILYNWDMHPKIKKHFDKEWLDLLNQADEIWTQTKYHADYCKEVTGLDHYVMPMGAPLVEELSNAQKKICYEKFAIMASRRDTYKGWDTFEKGCEFAEIPHISCHPNKYSREEYIDFLKRAGCMVIASEEEANSPMSSYEAAYMRKPLLLSDIPANREEWGNAATYFKVNDIEDFSQKLHFVLDGKADSLIDRAFNRVQKYTAEEFVKRISDRVGAKYHPYPMYPNE